MVDLFGLFMLLIGAVSSGPPDAWHWYVGAGVRYAYGEGDHAITLTLSADPTPIRYRRAPDWLGWRDGWTCGLTDGYNVWIQVHDPCTLEGTMQHELNHIQQRRALGPIGVAVLWGLNLNEPPDGYTASLMRVPHGDGFSLFRLEIPLLWR